MDHTPFIEFVEKCRVKTQGGDSPYVSDALKTRCMLLDKHDSIQVTGRNSLSLQSIKLKILHLLLTERDITIGLNVGDKETFDQTLGSMYTDITGDRIELLSFTKMSIACTLNRSKLICFDRSTNISELDYYFEYAPYVRHHVDYKLLFETLNPNNIKIICNGDVYDDNLRKIGDQHVSYLSPRTIFQTDTATLEYFYNNDRLLSFGGNGVYINDVLCGGFSNIGITEFIDIYETISNNRIQHRELYSCVHRLTPLYGYIKNKYK